MKVEILGVILPDKATLKIVECEQAVKGDTATSASKKRCFRNGIRSKSSFIYQSR